MNQRIVGWPMYAVDPAAVEAFWLDLRHAMRAVGVEAVPVELALADDLLAHWRSPDLLLSQTCGYPLVTALRDQVRYVATPRFCAPGCTGSSYSSAIVVRRDDPATGIDECAGMRVAFNARDSQSGYNALRALVAPLAHEGRFFAQAIETGAHRQSLVAVAAGVADLAAIDAVTFALVSQHRPEETVGLRVLGCTEQVPGLPLITARRTSDSEIALLRSALVTACAGPAAAALLLTGIDVLPLSAYDVIGDMRDRAVAKGYPELA